MIHSSDITFQMLEDWRNVDLNSITKQTLYTMEDSREEHRSLIIDCKSINGRGGGVCVSICLCFVGVCVCKYACARVFVVFAGANVGVTLVPKKSNSTAAFHSHSKLETSE